MRVLLKLPCRHAWVWRLWHAQRPRSVFEKVDAWQELRGTSTISGAAKERYGWKHLEGLALAGLAAATYSLYEDASSHCAADLPLANANPKGDQFVTQFQEWLRGRDCDTAAIAIAPSLSVRLPSSCFSYDKIAASLYPQSSTLEASKKTASWSYPRELWRPFQKHLRSTW